MRKGEILGLRKSDVDLEGRKVAVARSYDRDTIKGGHTDVIPLAKDCPLPGRGNAPRKRHPDVPG